MLVVGCGSGAGAGADAGAGPDDGGDDNGDGGESYGGGDGDGDDDGGDGGDTMSSAGDFSGVRERDQWCSALVQQCVNRTRRYFSNFHACKSKC